MRQANQCMFGETDADQAGNILKAAIVETMIKLEITFDKFSILHREYMVNIGAPADKIASSRNNLLKDLFSKRELTYKRFEFIMKNILGLNLTNWSMTLYDKDNKQHYLSIDRISY